MGRRALARCVGDEARFLAERWSSAPHLERGADPGAFADLLSTADVDTLLSSSLPRLPEFRLVRDGRPLDPAAYTRRTSIGGRQVTGVGDPAKVWAEFDAGATIVLQSLQRYWPPLSRFCRALELELTHPVQANAYVTPSGAQGLGVHHDTHDVFVLQLAGPKRWTVFEPAVELPLPSQPWSSCGGEAGEALLTVDLEPGDCLYLPRGFPHAAAAQQDVSAHLTLGVLVVTWHDVARELVATTAADTWFRQALPAGWADTVELDLVELVRRLHDHLDKVELAPVGGKVVRRFWSRRPALLAGQMEQLRRARQLSDTSVVRRRPGSVCRTSCDGARLVLLLGDRELRMPAAVEPLVQRLASGREVTVGELSDLADEPSRHVLVRRLVREGLLEVL